MADSLGELRIPPSSSATSTTTAFNVKSAPYSAAGDGVTDDTAAIQAAITAAAAVQGNVYLPRGTYRITSSLTVAAGLKIYGDGCVSLNGPAAANYEALTMPMVSPYLTGSVILVDAAATHGITITGAGIAVFLKDFGIRFATPFVNTGHGVYHLPPTKSGGREQGLVDAEWDNVQVFGHDGDHYGFYLTNPACDTLINLRAYGGGILCVDQNDSTGGYYYGNLVIDHIYGVIFDNGTSHGIYLKNTAGLMNLVTFIRPQTWTRSETAAFPTSTAPAATQYGFKEDGCQYLTMINPDIEGGTYQVSGAPGLASIGKYTPLSESPWSDVVMRPAGATARLMNDLRVWLPVTAAGMAARPDPVVRGAGSDYYDTTLRKPIWSDGADWRDAVGGVAYIAGTSGGAGTAPGSVAGGPVEDWDFDLGLTDGAAIATVASTGSGGTALAQATGAKQPTFKTALVNGFGAARFDGVNDRLQAAFTLNQPCTLFLVYKNVVFTNGPATQSANSTILDGVTNTMLYSNTTTLGAGTWPSSYATEMWAGSWLTYANSVAKWVWEIVTIQVNGASSLFRRNGTQIVAGAAGPNNPGGISLGGLRNDTKFAQFDITRLAVFNTALSSANMQAVERWLGTRYGIAAA